MTQFMMNTAKKTEKIILEIFLEMKFDRSKKKAKNIPAKQTMEIVFSIPFISENLKMLRFIRTKGSGLNI